MMVYRLRLHLEACSACAAALLPGAAKTQQWLAANTLGKFHVLDDQTRKVIKVAEQLLPTINALGTASQSR
jgi:hypothetical protein